MLCVCVAYIQTKKSQSGPENLFKFFMTCWCGQGQPWCGQGWPWLVTARVAKAKPWLVTALACHCSCDQGEALTCH